MDATKFAKDLYTTTPWAGALGDQVPVAYASGFRRRADFLRRAARRQAQPTDLVFWHSKETGDWLTPCALPSERLVSIRARESGEILDLDRVAFEHANLSEYSLAYWFVTGTKVAGALPEAIRASSPAKGAPGQPEPRGPRR